MSWITFLGGGIQISVYFKSPLMRLIHNEDDKPLNYLKKKKVSNDWYNALFECKSHIFVHFMSQIRAARLHIII